MSCWGAPTTRIWTSIPRSARCRTCGWPPRAEGIGIGWVSIFHESDLKRILGLPGHVTPVAYLCVGHVDMLFDRPELAVRRWADVAELDSVVMEESWT